MQSLLRFALKTECSNMHMHMCLRVDEHIKGKLLIILFYMQIRLYGCKSY